MTTAQEILAGKKPAEAEHHVYLDPGLAAARDRARERLDELHELQGKGRTMSGDVPPRPLSEAIIDAEADLEEATEAADKVRIVFRVRSIGRKRWAELESQHPPTKDQRERHRRQTQAAGLSKAQAGSLAYNEDTFVPAVLAEAIVEPEFTVEQAAQLWASTDWSSAETVALWRAVDAVQGFLPR